MNNKIKLEYIFIILSIFFGILFAIIVPPFQSPDENNHFLKAYHLSKGEIYAVNTSKKGYCISDNMYNYITNMQHHMSDYDYRYTYNDIYFEQLLGEDYSQCTKRHISTETTNPIAHIIPAIGIQITDFLKPFGNDKQMNVTVMLQFARISNVIVYSLICFFALKITTRFKKSMFLILLLPNAIYLRSMVSYDGLILSITALSLSLIIKLFTEKNAKLDKKYIAIFVIMGFILFNIKIVYSIVFLPLLFLDKNKIINANKVKTYSLMIFLVLLITFLFKIPYMGIESTVSDIGQSTFVKKHIIYFVKVIIVNIFNDFRTQMYWMNGTLGLLDTYMPVISVFMVNLILIITILIDSITEKKIFKTYINILYFALSFLSVFAMYSIMYLSWTPQVTGVIGGNLVTGIQGRYFIPLLLLLPIIFNNSIIKNKKIINVFNKISDNMSYILPIFATLQMFIMVLVLLQRFYF